MRLQSLAKWDDIPELDGLLFFAQLLDEMLFHYTLDSYKAPALNTRLLCYEASIVIDDIKGGVIQSGALKPIIEELKWSLQNDPIAQKIIGPKFTIYFESLSSNDLSLNDLSIRINSMLRTLDDHYFEETKNQLIQAVLNPHEKNLIRNITRIFITDLLNSGYHQNYVYYLANRYFFEGKKPNRFTNPNQIEGFLNYFDFTLKEFKVVFKASKSFTYLEKPLKLFEIELAEKIDVLTDYEQEKKFIDDLKEDEIFLIKEIKALDHQGARELAEKFLIKVANFFGYYYHSNRPKWLPEAMVYRLLGNNIAILDKDAGAVFSQTDVSIKQASAKSELTIKNMLHLEDSSYSRFNRAIDLHSVALEANAIENQLLDLWAAFESLLPKISDNGKDRINYLCEAIIPILRYNYITKLIRCFISDALKWDKVEVNNIYKDIVDGANIVEKTAALLSISTYEDLRKRVYSKLKRFPLLKNRMYILSQHFSSANSINNLLFYHSKRVTWHIMRIYRTRNLLIHTGIVMPYTDILVENLHSYLDQILDQIKDFAISRKINDIEQIIFETKLADELHQRILQQGKKQVCDSSNFKSFLFGNINSI